MDEQKLQNIRSRADAKLRWAKAHYDEMIAAGNGGSDFERSHLESSLFHLIGARDAFLAELVEYYSLEELGGDLSVGRVRNALKEQNKSTNEIAELYLLEQNATSWFYQAKLWRDHTTHKAGLQHHFSSYIGSGGATPGPVRLRTQPDPNDEIDLGPILQNKREELTRNERDRIEGWIGEMATLLERLRETALTTSGIKGD
ncbi:MAG: hypothetical protein ABL999_20970 [Pyrinomonadaceae bacterium]